MRRIRLDAYLDNDRVGTAGPVNIPVGQTAAFGIDIPAQTSNMIGGPRLLPEALTLRAVAGDERTWVRQADPRFIAHL